MQPPSRSNQSSGNLTADRRLAWARDLEARGDLAGAADLCLQALELVPAFVPAWFALGEALEAAGKTGDAVHAYRQALAFDPQDRHGARLCLARLGAVAPGEMPPAYLQCLFDGYAGEFDTALRERLGYRAPEMLREAVAAVCGRAGRPLRFGSMLDLGCGTGLAAVAFRTCADWICGVDLSAGMIAQARKKVIYDRLHTGDMLAFLDAEAANNALFHLVLAADVFVYRQDLRPLAAAVSRVLAGDGLLAFTVETHEGEGTILRETLRFAHASGEVRAAIESAGLRIASIEDVSTRTEKAQPVPGLLVVAARQD